MQVIMLKKDFETIQFLQIFMAVIFGFFIDFALFLLSWINASNYILQITYLVASCTILALGTSMEVMANVVMLAGEGLTNAISRVTNIEFGKIKIQVDVTLVTLSILFSFIYFGQIKGIREGTIIASFLVGAITRLFMPKMKAVISKFI
jgi:hypothetical protein